MKALADADINFDYPGAVMILIFGARTPAANANANANKQAPSALKVWPGARAFPIFDRQGCVSAGLINMPPSSPSSFPRLFR